MGPSPHRGRPALRDGGCDFPRIPLPADLRGRVVRLQETVHPADITWLPDLAARVTELGATFADTLSDPARCGGMVAVLQMWETMALTHLEAIVAPSTDRIEDREGPSRSYPDRAPRRRTSAHSPLARRQSVASNAASELRHQRKLGSGRRADIRRSGRRSAARAMAS